MSKLGRKWTFVVVPICLIGAALFAQEPLRGNCGIPGFSESVRVKLRYTLGPHCTLQDVRVISTDHPDELTDYAICQLSRLWARGSRPMIDRDIHPKGMESITLEQYQALATNQVAQNPDVEHVRGFHVYLGQLGGDRAGELTCYFSEDWTPTGDVITTYNDTGEPVTQPFDRYSDLPEQKFTVTIGRPEDE